MVQMAETKDRPAYVTFHQVPVEDRQKSAAAGYYVAMDVDYVHITPAGTKDVIKFKVKTWLEQMKVDAANGRIPEPWIDAYQKQYEAWKNGQSIPLNGTPIKGWGVISPAQQETLIHMNILTVEDMAALPDEGVQRIGMGAVDLKNKAKAWLAQMVDKGPLTMEMAALKQENAVLTGSVETLTRQVQELMSVLKIPQGAESSISASDILDDDTVAQYTAKFGPPHHRMKVETMAARLKE